MKHTIALLLAVVSFCAASACTDLYTGMMNNRGILIFTPPVLNNLTIESAGSSTITLSRPTFARSGNLPLTVQAYIGLDGAIKVSGTMVSGADQGPVDVSSGGHRFSGLTQRSLYRIVVVAQNLMGYSVQQITQVSALSPPEGVAARQSAEGQVGITWTAVPGATSYTIYWSDSPGVTVTGGARIAGITGTIYRQTGVPAGATRYYIVTAVNPEEESAPSTEVSVVTGEYGWSALGTGTDKEVTSLVIDSSGTLYAGEASVSTAGTTQILVVRWDGAAWSALGTGFIGDTNNIQVRALACDSSGILFTGGYFDRTGATVLNRIAQWNGASWSPLGTGTGALQGIHALAIYGNNNLYAGGVFTTIGGISADRIARWNGSSWSALSADVFKNTETLTIQVKALAIGPDGSLYVGGEFTEIGSLTVNRIARWNGASWSSLGGGLTRASMRTWVSALAFDSEGNLYAGGRFDTAGGVAANNIARWDGASWSALGTGIGTGDNDIVQALACDAYDNLYIGGFFNSAGGVAAHGIALWDGSSYRALDYGVSRSADTSVQALALDSDGNLYVGGSFTHAGNAHDNPDAILVNRIAKWGRK